MAPAGVESRRRATRVILVVDDSLTVREAVREAFAADESVRVLACGDVEAAEILLREESPDVLLCDVVLPGRSGYELCAAVKEGRGPSVPPVLLLTGAFEPFDPRRAEEAGADAVVSKPFTLAEIREVVQRAVSAAAPVEASVLAGASAGEAAGHPEITEEDLVADLPPSHREGETPTDQLARRLVEPLSRCLAAPVAESLAHRLLESQPFRGMILEAVAAAAERLVRQRLEELEKEAASGPESGPGGGAD